MAAKKIPLVVDLDGTYLRVDSLFELLSASVRSNWQHLFRILFHLAKGRQSLKELAGKLMANSARELPVNTEVVELIRSAKRDSRKIVLATASHNLVAEAIATETRLFDEVIASDLVTNVKGEVKAKLLVDRFGAKGFDYIGDSRADLPVFGRARIGYLVGQKTWLMNRARRANPELREIETGAKNPWAWLILLRPHQWLKNLLVMIPMVGAGYFQIQKMADLVLAFIAFSFVASGLYVVNDILDASNDRLHSKKKSRPIAAGEIGIRDAAIGSIGIFVAGVVLSSLLGTAFLGILLVYAALSLSYSLALKRVVLVDVFALSFLYLVRIFAGALVVGVSLSLWLITFGFFVFLSLALAKRYTEIVDGEKSIDSKGRGRGYLFDDAPFLGSAGISVGAISALLLGLYVAGPGVGSDVPLSVFWLAVPLWLLWVTRLWLLAFRRKLHSDPVVFAISDPSSILVGTLLLALFVMHSF